jgi:ribosomal protein S18 acetylase RimI-like enzyme
LPHHEAKSDFQVVLQHVGRRREYTTRLKRGDCKFSKNAANIALLTRGFAYLKHDYEMARRPRTPGRSKLYQPPAVVMRMIEYTTAKDDNALRGIADLQKRNHLSNIDETEAGSQGFLTVLHSMKDLQKMNAIEQHVIAVDNGRVIAYLLAMTSLSRNDIPLLVPMFDMIETIGFAGVPLSSASYIVIGQACVSKEYRGQGVFDALYNYYAQCFSTKYRYAVTEIDATNTRSLRAHTRVGFRTIRSYVAPNGVTWHIVLWDWNKTA